MSSKRRHTQRHDQDLGASLPQDASANEQIWEEQDPSSATPRPIARQQAYEPERIGDILRRRRERRGEALEAISEYLRIRPNYLFALENNRYEDLPADAYVIGFLRTYALYLGLDGKSAIDQYRREMTGRRRKPQLSMPQPMLESRAPTITALIGAVIAALLIYGIWYGLSSPEQSAAEKTIMAPPIAETTPPPSVTAEEANALPIQTATSDGITLPVAESAVPATQMAIDVPKPATETQPITTESKEQPKQPAPL
ncbi:MAG: helix-turn-helix domain-containing protein, partial [Bdellovibrionales bacterium]